jgi:hypothetical protein
VFAIERLSSIAIPRMSVSSSPRRNWTEIDFPKAVLRFLCWTGAGLLAFLLMQGNLVLLVGLVKDFLKE